MHQITKSSVESHDSGSERRAGVSSRQDNQHSSKLGERDQYFHNLPLLEAKYWGFAFDRPSNPSHPTPNEQQTALDLDLSEDENVRLFRKQCNNHLGGVRSEHELQSHRDREHSKGQTSTVKRYICIQPTGPGHPTPLVSLSRCKKCMQNKQYGAYYNAAAHIRRAHFKAKAKAHSAIGKEAARISGERGGDWPPMSELKSWFKEVNIPVTESTSSSHPNLAGFDDEVDDDFSLSSNLAQDPVSDGRLSFLVNSQLRDFEKFDKTMLDSGPPVPTTLDSLDSNKYKTALDSDLSQEEYGYGNTLTPQKYPFLTPFYTQSEGMRHTLASLGWNRDTELLKLYTFIVPNGREPFLELLPQWSPTYETPSRVHLDPPR
jgi:hypothetical protein